MLTERQRKIQDLHHEVYRLRIPVVIVYEAGMPREGEVI